MSRYKIATKTDILRYQIAKEVFGEIEDSDGVRDIPSWEIFEKCLEQHRQLKEMKGQLALTEKALELACGVLKLDEQDTFGIGFGDIKIYCDEYIKNEETGVDKYINYFKTKAKEIKDE